MREVAGAVAGAVVVLAACGEASSDPKAARKETVRTAEAVVVLAWV